MLVLQGCECWQPRGASPTAPALTSKGIWDRKDGICQEGENEAHESVQAGRQQPKHGTQGRVESGRERCRQLQAVAEGRCAPWKALQDPSDHRAGAARSPGAVPTWGPMPSPETAAAQRIGTAEMASLPVVLSVSTATAAATVRQLLPEASAPPSLGRANGMVSSLACNGRAQTAQWLLPVRQVP